MTYSQFRKAEVVEHIPAKTGISKQTKRKSVRDEVEVNMMSVYRMLQQNKAREMEFSVIRIITYFSLKR